MLHLKTHEQRLLKKHEVVQEMLSYYNAAEFSSPTRFSSLCFAEGSLKSSLLYQL